jgi:Zn-dependent protease with chaperone function
MILEYPQIRIKAKHLLLLVSFFIVQICFAQNLENFTRLKSEGDIPKEITSSSAKKYKVLESSVEIIKESRTKKKQKRKFFLESTFAIDEMMKNGLIIFNDPVSNYVSKVADKLLAHEPKLKEKIKFYTVRSSQVNAFATDRGAIFINLGLLAKLETEAQLAFIMAHEITHVLEKHNMDVFLEYENVDSSNKGFRNKNNFDKLLYKSNYSKSIEKEADEGGLELFLGSPYGVASLDEVFDILATAHTPFINEPFDLSYFDVGGIELPDSIMLDTVNAIQKYEEDQELSTHPGVKIRREKLLSSVADIKSSTKLDFIVGEAEFMKVKAMAQFEVCNILIENLSYPAALYHTYALSKKYPNNSFLERAKIKALYGLAKCLEDYGESEFFEDIDDIQGEMQQVFHVLDELSESEIRSLAAAHVWEYYQAHPKDDAMKRRAEDILMEIREFDEGRIKYFTGEKTKGRYHTEGIFAKYNKSSEFKKLLKKERKARSEQMAEGSLEKGYKLGLDKIVFVNPHYLRINMKNKKQPIQFIESENRQEELIEMIKKNGRKLKLGTKFMDVNSLSKRSKAEKFNEIIVMEDWIQQKINLPLGMVPNNHNEATRIMKENKIKHLAFIGALAVKDKKSIGSYIGNGLLTGTILFTPIGIFKMANPKHKSFYYTIVVDTEKQDVVMSSYNVMSQKDKKSIVNANLYWLMLQMKKKPKK